MGKDSGRNRESRGKKSSRTIFGRSSANSGKFKGPEKYTEADRKSPNASPRTAGSENRTNFVDREFSASTRKGGAKKVAPRSKSGEGKSSEGKRLMEPAGASSTGKPFHSPKKRSTTSRGRYGRREDAPSDSLSGINTRSSTARGSHSKGTAPKPVTSRPSAARSTGPRGAGSRGSTKSGGAEREDKLRKTLDRILSRAGVGSRTLAAEWIRAGRVKVNGRVKREPETWVHPGEDRVQLDGRLLRPEDRLYILLYKPKGYLCTREDPAGRPTIYELLTDVKSWVFNVGRLDRDTSGLLILTNDTELGELLTNPAYKVPKTYLVKANCLLSDEQLQSLRKGVELKDGPTLPAVVRRVRDSGKYTHLEIQIYEGRNRQVRRMLEAIDSQVLKLVRTSIGPLEIAGLEIGKHRPLTNDEVQALKSLAMASGAKPLGKRQKRDWDHEADNETGTSSDEE